VNRAIDNDIGASVFTDGDNGICGAVKIFAHTVSQIALNARSKRFADIHLSSGDLYAHA
jgi:hypothetical protein